MIPHVREFQTRAKPYPVLLLLLLHVTCQTAAAIQTGNDKRTNSSKHKKNRQKASYFVFIFLSSFILILKFKK
jgi:hypothetical protein